MGFTPMEGLVMGTRSGTVGPGMPDPSLPTVQVGNELLGSHHSIGVLNDALHLVPVDVDVEPHAQPTAAADVRRPKETLRLFGHAGLLGSRWCRAPDAEDAVA